MLRPILRATHAYTATSRSSPSDRYSRKHIHSLLACLGLSVMYPIACARNYESPD